MTNAIWKFPLKLQELQLVDMPKGAVILGAHAQERFICIWALIDVDPIPSGTPRRIRIRGTGFDFNLGTDKFVDTVLQGSYVWHIFDGGEI